MRRASVFNYLSSSLGYLMSGEPHFLPVGTLLAGKFRVVRLLGQGGMGSVYEIEHELTKHRRALKLLHRGLEEHPLVVERFLREASAAGRIGNAHIVEVFDAGTLEGGEPYVVLELLAGETLAARLARDKQLDLASLVDLVAQACEGVEAAHAAGIVHRDLKPENLFLVLDGARPPFVKILDFGVSKFDVGLTGGLALTRDGTALGTPLYMPPEQVRGQRDLDGRADVYALGVILYECATGEPPFLAETLPQLAVLIHEGKVDPLPRRRPDLPPSFVDVVARAMAVERDARMGTPGELGQALRGLPELGWRSRPPVSPSGGPPGRLPSLPPAAPSRAALSPSAPAAGRVLAIAVVVGGALVIGGAVSFHRHREGAATVDSLPIPPSRQTGTVASAPRSVPGASAAAEFAPPVPSSSTYPFSTVATLPSTAPAHSTPSKPAAAASAHPAANAPSLADKTGLAKDLDLSR